MTLKYQFIEIHIEINLNHLGVVGVETNTVLLLRIENNSQKSEHIPFVEITLAKDIRKDFTRDFSSFATQTH